MLLTRVAAELNTNHELSESLLPVRFMEESHEIFNLADFWLDTLFYLARESTKHDPVLAGELQETHADLAYPESELISQLTDKLQQTHTDLAYRRQTLADRARAAVLEAADRLGKNSSSWSRTYRRSGETWTKISAGSYAEHCNRSPRSCYLPLPRVALRV